MSYSVEFSSVEDNMVAIKFSFSEIIIMYFYYCHYYTDFLNGKCILSLFLNFILVIYLYYICV